MNLRPIAPLFLVAVLLPNCRPATPVAPHPAAEPTGNRSSIDLSGQWEFRIDPLDVGRAEKWFAAAAPYEQTMQVPGAWNAMGAEFPSEKLRRDYEQRFLNGRNLPGPEGESEKLFHVFPGPAWYRKTVRIPSEWKGRIPWLVFGGVHREAEVWINGQPAGSHRSYLTPFPVNLSNHAQAGEKITIVVRVDARRNKDVDPLMGCFDTLDFLYISWGGLYRKVTLEATPPAHIDEVFVLPKINPEIAEVQVATTTASNEDCSVLVEILDAAGVAVASVRRAVSEKASETVLAARIPNARLWSPKTPTLYRARVRLLSRGLTVDTQSVRFGMREFKVESAKFLLNNKPIFLRGYGDDCIFPNSICPPADKSEFLHRLSTARDYGFNYVRLHSWIPTVEYLDAADELGMMLQPEFPFAYRWDLPQTPDAKHAALEAWKAMIRLNRNHPSIVTWCMGNEQYDSFDLAPEMYREAKLLDPSRPVVDTDGCGFNHKDRATLDFMVVQFAEGGSIGFQDWKYSFPREMTKPVMAHEMGYFVTLPDLSQLDLFHTGLRPYWLIQARETVAHRRLQNLYPSWLASSYRLQSVSLKCNLEAARRSRLSGTSVWLFQDYPNCAEGVVDMFLRPKSLRPEEFRKFNTPTVLLMDAPRRNWWAGETAEVKILVSRYEDDPSDTATLRWTLRADGKVRASGTKAHLHVSSNGVQELLSLQLKMPQLPRGEQLTLTAQLNDGNGKTENSWSFWVFPETPLSGTSQLVRFSGPESLRRIYPWSLTASSNPSTTNTGLLVTTRLGPGTLDYLKAGGRAILLDPEPAFAVEKTNFRLSSWDGGGPSGTILDRTHPALRDMPSEGWCDLQFYTLIQDSKTVSLDPLPSKIEPLVRCIDRPTRLADRAYLFEASVGRGKLLVSGFNFAHAIEQRDPAGLFLLDRLIRYALGPDFAPKAALPVEALSAEVVK